MLVRLAACLCAFVIACAVTTGARADAVTDKAERESWATRVTQIVNDHKNIMLTGKCINFAACTAHRATYSFNVDYAGYINDLKRERSSGDQDLDNRTLGVLQSLEPFPPLNKHNSNTSPLRIFVDMGFVDPGFTPPPAQTYGQDSSSSGTSPYGESHTEEKREPEVNLLPPEYIDPSMPTRTESGVKHLHPFNEPAYGEPVGDHKDCVNSVTGIVRGNAAEASRLCRERN